jgi:Protein of unknown function (DUF4427)
VLTLVDGDIATESTFGFVLVRSRIRSLKALQDPVRLSREIGKAIVNLEPYFRMPRNRLDDLAERFAKLVRRLEKSAPTPKKGELGGCWLWLHDNGAPLTRALLRAKRVFVTEDGRYLARLPEFSDARDLREREEMTNKLAKLVKKEFKTSSSYFSVLGSDDPTEVSFNSGHDSEDISFFNVTWVQ